MIKHVYFNFKSTSCQKIIFRSRPSPPPPTPFPPPSTHTYAINKRLVFGCFLIQMPPTIGMLQIIYFRISVCSQSPYFLTLMEPRNRFQGMNSASLCSLAGRYDNTIPIRFLTTINCLKIPAWLPVNGCHDRLLRVTGLRF